MHEYRSLDATKIVATAEALSRRIAERFPGSGLGKVAAELLSVTRESASVSRSLGRPNPWLRLLAGLAILFLAGAFVAVLVTAYSTKGEGPLFDDVAELVQGLEAVINEVVLTGVAIFFMISLESRWKRSRALTKIHVLRSLAHIIDMHQLTKDPYRVAQPNAGTDTPSSPERLLSPFELARYLDYSSELLAVLSKVGALYVQNFHDAVTLSAVNDLEDLVSGLSRKIWQKIMMLDRTVAPPNIEPPSRSESTAQA